MLESLKNPVSIIALIIIFFLSTLVAYMIITDIPIIEERNEFCELNGYKESMKSGIKELEGVKYIECYDEKIINNQFVIIKEWIVFKDGSDK